MGAVKHIALTGPIWNSSSNRVFSFCVFLVQVASSLLMMFYMWTSTCSNPRMATSLSFRVTS